jgi:hypothetical protein
VVGYSYSAAGRLGHTPEHLFDSGVVGYSYSAAGRLGDRLRLGCCAVGPLLVTNNVDASTVNPDSLFSFIRRTILDTIFLTLRRRTHENISYERIRFYENFFAQAGFAFHKCCPTFDSDGVTCLSAAAAALSRRSIAIRQLLLALDGLSPEK